TVEGHSAWIESVSLTPDGLRAVSVSEDKTVRLWDLESGGCLGIFVATAPICAVAIHSGLLTIGTRMGQVLSVEMLNLSLGPVTAPDTSDDAYEALLHRGLERNRPEKGPEHEETLAHLMAMAAHLVKLGRTDGARSLREEHDRMSRSVAVRK